MLRRNAFTLIELLVVISIIALLIAILLPALAAARTTAQQMANNTQLRGIIQGMVIYAQSNNHYYPGLNSHGQNAGKITPSTSQYGTNGPSGNPGTGPNGHNTMINSTFVRLLNARIFGPKYLISPGETVAKIKPIGPVQNTLWMSMWNYSYAISRYQHLNASAGYQEPGRTFEWTDVSNSQAVVITDRATNMGGLGKRASIWTTSTDPVAFANAVPASWVGGVGWNDGHVTFIHTSVVETTRYQNKTNYRDNLFSGLNLRGDPNAHTHVGYEAYVCGGQ